MESEFASVLPEKQTLDSGDRAVAVPLRRLPQCINIHESGTGADMAIIFDAFVSAVGRLEGILEKETTMLIEHRTIALEEFNHKKRHGLLELSRAMDAMRGTDHNRSANDPKLILAGLRAKLQKNLVMLQMHLDAVGTIAAIIAGAIQEHDSDGTYARELGRNGRSR
ncbi:hypothetical protein QEV83_05315 [Methylocapsa sp. D3K7]|uniref:hypothetical protein n=1 Tax=Methylocapsa sp. D3K7 TaxID=3041435 RepID=UPI00244EE040|nr:hypothetical protein [Methylocapsa sp. D3K7]WGJ15682.1 hypothetical protein QEV83_05315 [Methylocapsa sp. D3K7]